jgi:hypothetical protein
LTVIGHIPRPKVASVAIIFMTASGCGAQTRAMSSASTGGSRSATQVRVVHRCPSRPAPVEASPEPTTASVLVPAHPSGALICRCWGINESARHEATLAGAFSIGQETALDRLAARLDALPPFPRHSMSCPTFGGRSDLIFFHYRDGSDDPVRITRAGCVPVTNGRLLRTGLSLPYGHWPDDGLR